MPGLNNMCPSTVVSAHFPNALLTQRLENLRVTHQAQVTRRGLSYKAGFFSSATVPRETLHFSKSFTVVWEDIPSEDLFEKEPAPPPSEIQNSTATPSALGDHIQAGVFNASNRSEYISLVGNQGLYVDDNLEPAPNNVPLVDTPAADTLFEGHTWGWDGIDRRDVVA